MNAVEFDAVAKDGRIEIPADYVQTVKGPIRVIVLISPDAESESDGFFDELMNNPHRVPNFVPLTREEANERRPSN